MKNRTVIGIICMILAVAITFGIAPMVSKMAEGKVDVLTFTQNSGGLDFMFGSPFYIAFIWEEMYIPKFYIQKGQTKNENKERTNIIQTTKPFIRCRY